MLHVIRGLRRWACIIQMASDTAEYTVLKVRTSKRLIYVLLGLILLLGLVTTIVFWHGLAWGVPESFQELTLIGTWVGTVGNSLEFRPDGSAVGKAYSSVGIYRWKVESGVLSIEDCPLNPGPKWLARKCFEDFIGASRCDEYTITMNGDDLLTLTVIPSGKVLEFERCNGVTD
ncbi:hypothetical protein OAS39_01020 [Pirellulales bacterium]|nr:hypothetical protein [Pirellulales bacterium]